MTRILVTGTSSGLGKYLHSNIVDSSGLRRDNFDSVKNENFDIIVHCAFNKQNVISDYRSYLDDNIFLTQRLKDIRHSKFVYVSTIDVYQKDATMYSHFKKFSESMLDDDDLILRCSMMLGDTMKPNHLTRIRDNVDSITLSGESKFDYILMQDIKDFLLNESIDHHKGAIDFISNKAVKLEDVKKHFSSTTKLGDHTYNADLEFRNPVYSINEVYDRSSLENLKRYFK